MHFPDPDKILPQNTALTRFCFWLKYWVLFFLILPWIIAYQFFQILKLSLLSLGSCNRTYAFLEGQLKLKYINNLRSSIINIIFGERFLSIHYKGFIIDPGPPFAAKQIENWLSQTSTGFTAFLVTHKHEEHTGLIAHLANIYSINIYASKYTIAHIKTPENLPFMRKMFIGQPVPFDSKQLKSIEDHSDHIKPLIALPSGGHCQGHFSFYDPKEKILFAGDSFLHEVFTSPNIEVRAEEWLETLERYAALDIQIMIGSHGFVTTLRKDFTNNFFVIERANPNQIIRNKIDFINWSIDLVKKGEDRSLNYKVIEAALFPWQKKWSWQNWFIDEGARLLSGGEFSRTQFLRSLVKDPSKIPNRFT